MDDQTKDYFTHLASGLVPKNNSGPSVSKDRKLAEIAQLENQAEINLPPAISPPATALASEFTAPIATPASAVLEPVKTHPSKSVFGKKSTSAEINKTKMKSKTNQIKSKEEIVSINHENDHRAVSDSRSDFFTEAEGQLTIDVYQTPTEIVIASTIAGARSEDLSIDITGESVSIHGARHRSEKISDDDFFYQECYWGRFSRSVILPEEIDPDQAKASLKDGVLTIRLPKLNRVKNRRVKIKIT